MTTEQLKMRMAEIASELYWLAKERADVKENYNEIRKHEEDLEKEHRDIHEQLIKRKNEMD